MMTNRLTLYVALTLTVCLVAVALRFTAVPAHQIDLYAAEIPPPAARADAIRDAAESTGAARITLHEIPGKGLRLRVFSADAAFARTAADAVRARLAVAGLDPRLAVESRARGGFAVYAASAGAVVLLAGLVALLGVAAVGAAGALLRDGDGRITPASAST